MLWLRYNSGLDLDQIFAGAIALSGNGRRLATVGFDRVTPGQADTLTSFLVARVWDPASGGLAFTVPGSAAAVSLSGDGTRLAVWGVTPAAAKKPAAVGFRVYDLARGAELCRADDTRMLPNTGELVTLSLSPDGNRLAVGTKSGYEVWDATAGKLLARLTAVKPAPFTGPREAVWSPDGRRLLLRSPHVPGKTGTRPAVTLHDAGDGRLLGSFAVPDGFGAQPDWSPDGKLLASPAADTGPGGRQVHTVAFWDGLTGRRLGRLPDEHGLPVTGASWSPGGWLVTTSYDRLARVWDMAGAEKVGAVGGKLLSAFEGHAGDVPARAAAAPGRFNPTYAGGWSPHAPTSATFAALAWDPSGKRVASASLLARRTGALCPRQLIRSPRDGRLRSFRAGLAPAPDHLRRPAAVRRHFQFLRQLCRRCGQALPGPPRPACRRRARRISRMKAMNISADVRLQQLNTNIVRLQSMSGDLGQPLRDGEHSCRLYRGSRKWPRGDAPYGRRRPYQPPDPHHQLEDL